MPLPVEQDETADPADVGLLGPTAVMAGDQRRPEAVEEPGRARRRLRRR
jgi:hypothetical protein